MSQTLQTEGRKDTTLNLSKETIAILGIVAKKEDRTMKGEVTFLVKTRAKELGLEVKEEKT